MKTVQTIPSFTWLTRVVIVGVAALPLAVLTVGFFPTFLEGLAANIPGQINYRAFSIMFTGLIWSVLILAVKGRGDGAPAGQAFTESLIGGLVAAFVTGASLYALNVGWILFLGRSFL